MIATLALLAVVTPKAQEATLSRVLTVGEKQEYSVKSHLDVEQRSQGLQTWVPSELDLLYSFTLEVKAAKADGIVETRYQRPTMTEILGETADSPPKKKVEQTKIDLSLTLSPVNEILAVKDLTKKPETKPKGKGGLRWLNENGSLGSRDVVQGIEGYLGEIYRLALFAGSFDSALDFSPKLPFDVVKPGDTWKKTVGYTPQKLKGKDGKSAVQRLDYTYRYGGIVDVKGKKVHRITAELEVVSDLAEFFNQMSQMTSEQSGLKEIPLRFKGSIEFDLDTKTCNVIKAVAKSEGGFKIVLTQFPDDPIQEEKLKGVTVMTRLK
jgi:hypothetical protein